MKLAVLLTVHNRKALTERCLRSLYDQPLPIGWSITVYLVDDGCSDGTVDMVQEKFPSVNLIQGNGDLYWNGGMRLAWQTAIESGFGYDGYLWLNDDVLLSADALLLLENSIRELLQLRQEFCILVGTCLDSSSHLSVYGGYDAQGEILAPDYALLECSHFNGNFAFVPTGVCQRIGILSNRFTHA